MHTLGTLDIIAVLKRELRDFEMPASTVSALAGISGGKLSSYLNGARRCPSHHDVALRRTWAQLKKLIHDAGMLPLDYRKVDRLRGSIAAMESGELQIVVLHQEAEAQ